VLVARCPLCKLRRDLTDERKPWQVVFSIDIVLNFLTGYIDRKDQRVIMHWRPVFIQYIKFWFCPPPRLLPLPMFLLYTQWGRGLGS